MLGNYVLKAKSMVVDLSWLNKILHLIPMSILYIPVWSEIEFPMEHAIKEGLILLVCTEL